MTTTNPNLIQTSMRLGGLALSVLALSAACANHAHDDDSSAAGQDKAAPAEQIPTSLDEGAAPSDVAPTTTQPASQPPVGTTAAAQTPKSAKGNQNKTLVGTPTACTPISRTIGVLNACGFAVSFGYSPDGKLLAVGDSTASAPHLVTGGLQVYQLSDGTRLTISATDDWGARTDAVAFSPDGKYLLAGITRYDAAPATVKILGFANDHELTQTGALTVDSDSFVSSVVFSHAGNLLATAGGPGAVEVWNTSDWTRVQSIPVATNVWNIHFSPDDSKLLVVTYGDSKARVWRVADATLLLDTIVVSAQDADADFSPDGSEIAASYTESYEPQMTSYLRIWDATTGVMKQSFRVDNSPINQMTWLAPDRIVANHGGVGPITWTRQPDGTFVGSRIIDAALPPLTWTFAISPDGKTLAADWIMTSYEPVRESWVFASGFSFFSL